MNNYKAKKQGLSPLERFWKDQNQKLLAHANFCDELGNLFDDTLNIRRPNAGNSVTPLDFSVFDLPHLKVENPATLTLDGKSYPLSMKEYAKLTLVTTISGKSDDPAAASYQMLRHVAGFLNEQECDAINQENIEAFHVNFLTQSVNESGWSTRLSTPSYGSSYGKFFIHDSRKRLKLLGVDGVFEETITQKRLNNTLGSACQSVMGMALNEYKKGGSFNSLTLEMGQYYVDHMKRVYEQNYLYLLVCEGAIKSVRKQFDLYSTSGGNSLQVLSDTIRGSYIATVKSRTGKKSSNAIHDAMSSALYEQYLTHFDKVQSLREENICQVVKALELGLRFDSVEVIRLLMLQKHYDFGSPKTPESVWQGYLRSLDETEIKTKQIQRITVHDVYELMAEVVAERRLDNASFLASLSEWSSSLSEAKLEDNFKALTNGFRLIKDAMCTLVVAWLGYRKSEFGFPLSAIHAESNLDVLDNNHVPFRFKLKWVVPKTNGVTKIDREITSQCYQLAAQLNCLYQPIGGDPCLYSSERLGISNFSASPITERVGTNWATFVTDYEPFVAVHELERLTAMGANEMSEEDKGNLERLRTQYDLSSARVQHLLAASKEVKRDIVKLEYSRAVSHSGQKAFSASIVEYSQTGDVSNDKYKQVIEKHLSDETRQWLQSDGVNLDRKGMMDISKELLQGVRYPTPHAFRHIWAEAVLTRYQGDVGAVIRHQFCHMDDSFFMAYLRDKEVKGLMQAARIKLANSIVDMVLIEANREGNENVCVGGFARFIKKATSLTQAVTINDIRTLRDRIVGRVISIQPDSFVTCIPREGSEAQAMCSEVGELNPQNAKPEFCLVCINGLITSGNIKGIWKTIQPFVKECLDENVMGFMVQSNLPTLRSSYKRIDELKSKANAGQVDIILGWIKKAIDSVEEKLATEEGLYV